MSEWWTDWTTYRPADFLLFSPRTYHRLFELYNADIWPLQIVTLLAGVAILVLMYSRVGWRGRAVATILAACWLWIAWAFHWNRYSTINWAATWFTAAFVIEAALLVWFGGMRDRLKFEARSSIRARLGLAVFVFALLLQPLAGLMVHRQWTRIEVFGVAPDPTAVATLGVLLAANRFQWQAAVIPLLWCVVSGLTLYVLSGR